MQISINPLNFGYSNQLKTLYKKGMLPSVKIGIYGDKLTPKNVSLEHLKCVCDGGKTELKNLVLATKENNNIRGNKPLENFLTIENLIQYLNQFKDIKVMGFNGNNYIALILKTIGELINDR